jgi:hypothetical protein
VRNNMIFRMGFIVIKMLKWCHILSTKEEWNEGVSVIDSI